MRPTPWLALWLACLMVLGPVPSTTPATSGSPDCLAPKSLVGVYQAGNFKSLRLKIHRLAKQAADLDRVPQSQSQRALILFQMDQALAALSDAMSDEQIASFGQMLGSLQGAQSQPLQKWFLTHTALNACKHVQGTVASRMPDGSTMNAAAHNAALFRVLDELAAGDKEAFYNRHRAMPPQAQRTDYESKVYDAFRQEYLQCLEDPDQREMLWVSTALHDYGKLLRGENHSADSVRIAAPLLERLGYEKSGKKYRWITLLIKLHVQLGGGLLLGEGSPLILIRAMQEGGLNQPKEREEFLKLLSLLTFADIGAVGPGRYEAGNLLKLRFMRQQLIENPAALLEDWPTERFLSLYGISAASSEAESLKEKVEDQGVHIREFLQTLELGYARFFFGPSPEGEPAVVQSANAMKWLTIAEGLWQATDKQFSMVRLAQDLHAPALLLDQNLADADFLQIRHLLRAHAQEIAQALRANRKVRLWGIPVSLSGNGETLLVNTADIQSAFDRTKPLEIDGSPLQLNIQESEILRAKEHLDTLRQMGHDFKDEDIRDPAYDAMGFLRFQWMSKKFDKPVTLCFANGALFDVDGDMQDLMRLVQIHGPIPEAAESDPKKLTRIRRLNAMSEDMRYFAFKRMVKYRDKASGWLQKIEEYLHTHKDPSQRVRDEVEVAVRMIQGGTVQPRGKRLNVSFLTYEAAPLIKKGGLGDVSGSLPRVLQNKRGHNVSVIMPYWPGIDEELAKNKQLELKNTGIDFRVDGHIVRVFSVVIDGTPIYLLRCEKYFNVKGNVQVDGRSVPIQADDIYRADADKAFTENHPHQTHPLNAETAVFFSKAALEAIEALAWQQHQKPDVLVSADWQTGLVPALVKKSPAYKDRYVFKGTRLVHTIHNLAFKGLVQASPWGEGQAKALWEKTGLPPDAYTNKDLMGLEAWGLMSLMKAGIVFADKVLTVSPQYASEIQTAAFGAGFDGLFRAIRTKLRGILNGLSLREWNPATTKELIVRMANMPGPWDRKMGIVDLPEGKRANKNWIKSKYGLKIRPGERVPLLSFVGRFEDQKGMHLLMPVLRKLLLDGKVQVLFAGKGAPQYHKMLEGLMGEFPGNVAYAGFVNERQVKPILAGSDMVLMPSIFEPCGLVQLQAMRYGAIPVASNVGGLANTVQDFSQSATGNGFVVDMKAIGDTLGEDAPEHVQAQAQHVLMGGLDRALAQYQDPAAWDGLVRKTFEAGDHYSWDGPALEYETVFREILPLPLGRPEPLFEPRVFSEAA